MKYTLLAGLAILSFGIFGCGTETPDNQPTTKTGTLKLVVSYETGDKAPNATVQLFTSQADYTSRSNAILTDQTDMSGEVYFEEIECVNYWWHVEDNNGYTNTNSSHQLGSNLPADKITQKLVQLR
ncbi:MAG: hypothetical protein KDC92_16020 [Bacteroidetes bacterium]|nr:hypothetical protein [Bacteroidota bacterium]